MIPTVMEYTAMPNPNPSPNPNPNPNPMAMTLWLLLCASLVVIMVFIIHPIRRRRTRKPEPPGLPIIGHILHMISGGDLLHVKLSRLADRYGPSIMFLKIGVRPMLVVSDPAAAKECFTTNDQAFASRPQLTTGELLGCDFKLLPWSPYGPYWREGRKTCTLELLSSNQLQHLAYIRDEETSNLVKGILLLKGSVAAAMREALSDVVTRIILRMVGGIRHLESSHQVEELKGLVEEAFLWTGNLVLGDWFPGVGWLDNFGATRSAMSRIAGRLDSMVQSWINARRSGGSMMMNEGDDEGGGGGGRDFMDAMFSYAEKYHPDASTEQKDRFIKPLLLTMIMGTMDTTSVALEWIFSELLNNPDALSKAQEEIQAKMGHGRKIQDSDIGDLPYLQALVKEGLRLHPSGPLLVPHESTQDCIVSGFNVPSGTLLMVNAWKIHRDPRWWDRPLQFEPERFLDGGSASHLDMRGSQQFQFIPFGAGRRACPGSSLAISIIHLTIARLLHAFEWKVPPGSSCVDMTEGPGLSCPKAIPLEALLIPIDTSQLYL